MYYVIFLFTILLISLSLVTLVKGILSYVLYYIKLCSNIITTNNNMTKYGLFTPIILSFKPRNIYLDIG